LIIAVPLSFVNFFEHEGGHGVLVVPAIALNGEIPAVGVEGENPFKNFPAAAILFLLSVPLGVLADGLVCLLSYRNARRYRNPANMQQAFLSALFLAFSLMTLKSALSNLLTGEDFSFIWIALGLPFHGNEILGYAIRAMAFLVFPIYLSLKRGFWLIESLAISIGALIGSYLAGAWLLPLMSDWLMAHFFWLFLIGLPVFVTVTLVLWRLQRRGEPEKESDRICLLQSTASEKCR